ncbi:MAG: succinate dehydrogenase iron-sulfur subunit [Verrucomicrobiota bacterium]|nr:succinate dehydrogenase iron-sulfur subunit [Verrucomicrobiota bacterium]
MKYTLNIYRGFPEEQYWEAFELPLTEGANVISALMEIQKNPINKEGRSTTPVAWESGCLEEVCGSCSILINGKPRQACTALIAPLLQECSIITLAPLSKFPLIRDLQVDRTNMFEALKRVKAWISIDSANDLHEGGPPIAPAVQEALYLLSTCMTCGCCAEACPQVHENSSFMGPAPLSQIRRFNSHPVGKFEAADRLRTAKDNGGIAGCGNAQNCARVCPKKIPLTESLSLIGRDTTKQALKDFFGLPDA